MNAATFSSAALVLALASAGSIGAQPLRCDCTSIVDTCSANVEAHGSYLDVKTNAKQCARVDYFVDGQPFVSVAVNGEDRRDWLARTSSPKIIVQSCQVCRDNGEAAVPRLVCRGAGIDRQQRGRATREQGGCRSRQGRSRAADRRRAGVSGGCTSASRRRLRRCRVHREPARHGRGRARHRLPAERHVRRGRRRGRSRWRFPAEQSRAPQTLTKRVDFKLDSRNATESAGGSRRSGPRNQCVREDAVYNYGDTVDVAYQCVLRPAPRIRLRARHGTLRGPLALQRLRAGRQRARAGKRPAARHALRGRGPGTACVASRTPTASR